MVDSRMRVELNVAAPEPRTPPERARFEQAMQDVSYVAGCVTTRAARAVHPMESRVLVVVVTSPALLRGALRLLVDLCNELGDATVLAWCVDVSLVNDRPNTDGQMELDRLLDPSLLDDAAQAGVDHTDSTDSTADREAN